MPRPIRLAVAAVVIVVVAGFLGFTKPGHQFLRRMNLMAACGSDANC